MQVKLLLRDLHQSYELEHPTKLNVITILYIAHSEIKSVVVMFEATCWNFHYDKTLKQITLNIMLCT